MNSQFDKTFGTQTQRTGETCDQLQVTDCSSLTLAASATLLDRLNADPWTPRQVRLAGYGNVATARRGYVAHTPTARLYSRLSSLYTTLKPIFEAANPGVALIPPQCPEALKRERASFLGYKASLEKRGRWRDYRK